MYEWLPNSIKYYKNDLVQRAWRPTRTASTAKDVTQIANKAYPTGKRSRYVANQIKMGDNVFHLQQLEHLIWNPTPDFKKWNAWNG